MQAPMMVLLSGLVRRGAVHGDAGGAQAQAQAQAQADAGHYGE